MPQGVHSVEAALVGLDEKKNFSEGVTFSPISVIVRFLGFDPIEGSARRVFTQNAARCRDIHGRMAEWLIVPPWKGGIRKFRIEGSNPSPSARFKPPDGF